MPRKLPWLNQNTKATAKANTTPKPVKRPSIQTLDLNEESPSNSASATYREIRRGDRQPSSSPILAPDISPPSPEFMKEGVDADDAWVMVEDEFLETANLFTQHLHRAEYQRLKELVGTQNESVMKNIMRPVASNTKVVGETAKRMEADAKSSSRRKVLQAITKGEADTPWMQDPRLSGLMNCPPASSALLASRTGAKANTRAAAGFAKAHPSPPRVLQEKFTSTSSKSRPSGLAGLAREIERPNTSDDDGDDDLNGPSRFRVPLRKPKKMHHLRERSFESTRTSQYGPRRDRPPDPALTPEGFNAPRNSSTRASSSSLSRSMAGRPSRSSAIDLLDNFDFPERKTPFEYKERLAKQKPEKANKERGEKRKSLLLEEIPTFLI